MKMDEAAFARFMAKVKPDANGCWVWTGTLSDDGYGRFYLKYKRYASHRQTFEHFKGQIPDGLQIDHLCRVRSCVNPDHLRVVTTQENTACGNAGKSKRADRAVIPTHCNRGHYLDVSNIYMRPDGRRSCRECQRIRQRKRGSTAAYSRDWRARKKSRTYTEQQASKEAK